MLKLKGQPIKPVPVSDKIMYFVVLLQWHWHHLFHSNKKTQTKLQSKNRHPCVGPCNSFQQSQQVRMDMMVINSSVTQQKDHGWDLCIYWAILCPPFIHRQASPKRTYAFRCNNSSNVCFRYKFFHSHGAETGSQVRFSLWSAASASILPERRKGGGGAAECDKWP